MFRLMVNRLWHQRVSSVRRPRHAPSRTSSFIPVVESLEDRRLLSFSPPALVPTVSSSALLLTADLNGDGKSDLIIANLSGQIGVSLGNGDGTFRQTQVISGPSEPTAFALADLRGNGTLDLVVINHVSNNLSVLLGNNDGTFQAPVNRSTDIGPDSVAIGDFNGDGRQDVIVSSFDDRTGNASSIAILFGNGDGSLQSTRPIASGLAATSIESADFNHDGKLDLALLSSIRSTVGVILGNGDGTFKAQNLISQTGRPQEFAVADFNHDGFADLADVDYSGGLVNVFINAGSGTFQSAAAVATGGISLTSIAVADLNQDGVADLVVGDFFGRSLFELNGNGDGSFKSSVTIASGYSPYNEAIADFNGDGAIDIAFTYQQSSASLLLNQLSVPAFHVTPPAGSITPSTVQSFTVQATDADGNLLSDYVGIIHFSSSDSAAVLPPDYTFTAADQGSHRFNITFNAVGGQSLSVVDSANNAMRGGVALTISAPWMSLVTQISVSTPNTTSPGTPTTIAVSALDAQGNPVESYTGTVHVSLSGTTGLSQDITFSAADRGVRTFTFTPAAYGVADIHVNDTQVQTLQGSATLLVPTHGIIATGTDSGSPEVKVFDAVTGALKYSFLPYDSAFTGGVRVAIGDVNGDGTPDIVTAPGPGGGPDVHLYDGKTQQLLRQWFAFDPQFIGGVNVAVGDVNDDGFDDIVVGADAGGGPNVIAYSGTDGSTLLNTFAYDPQFIGGVRVAVGNTNRIGIDLRVIDFYPGADIITGAGPGGGSEVKVIRVDGVVIRSFMAYDSQFIGGVYVAIGFTADSPQPTIITGAGAGGGPNVKLFNAADGTLQQSFFVYDATFIGGVRVAAVASDSSSIIAKVLTSPGVGGQAEVCQFDGLSAKQIDLLFAYPTPFVGGLFAAGSR